MIKTFTQHLVLWLHLLFVVFTIGPVTIAISSTPRYIRQRDVRIVRYLSRTTFIFALACIGVLIAGEALASITKVKAKGPSLAGQPWVIISATLFIVALALLSLIIRDQRRAIKALDEAAKAVPAPAARALAATPAAEAAAIASAATQAIADAPANAGTDAEPGEASAGAGPATGTSAEEAAAATPAAGATAGTPAVSAAGTVAADAAHVANVEQSRIAMMGGLVGLI